MKAVDKKHPFHLVDPSFWPLLGALSAVTSMVGMVLFMHQNPLGRYIALAGLIMILATMFFWWRDVVKEARVDKAHNKVVRHGLRLGMALFIVSEIMFFFAFFWAFFKAALAPELVLNGATHIFENSSLIHGTWPPKGIKTLDPWDIPFINTLILLLSGTTVTWAHYALYMGNRRDVVKGLVCTVVLGLMFSCIQAYEYIHATFKFVDGIYPSTFYMATGFHGAHVIIGTIFLTVCLFRAAKGQFSQDHHLGLEFAAWYWHFVDVVWLFLFSCVYIWGS